MRVKFHADYDYTPSGERRVTIAYKAGHELTVKREAGEAAIAAGRAKEVEVATRDPLDHDGDGRKGGAKKAEA